MVSTASMMSVQPGLHRNAELAKLRWTCGGVNYMLLRTPEQNLWRIVSVNDCSS